MAKIDQDALVRHTEKQVGKEEVELGAGFVDRIECDGLGTILAGRIEIGPQHMARHTGHRLDSRNALCRNARPTRYGRLCNAELARECGRTPDGL